MQHRPPIKEPSSLLHSRSVRSVRAASGDSLGTLGFTLPVRWVRDWAACQRA